MNTIVGMGAGTLIPRPATILASIMAAALTACAIRGPQLMPASRLAYNEAVQSSDQRELLLNVVRLRYLEAPEFLSVNGISTQMRFEAQGSIGGQLGESGVDDITLLSPGAAVGYSESPTITFTPQRDQTFTRQLVAPVDIDTIYLLSHYGWGLDRVLLLIASEVNGLANSVSREASHVGNEDVEQFRRLAAALRRLEASRVVRISLQRKRETLSELLPQLEVSANDVLLATENGLRFSYNADTASYVLTDERVQYVLAVAPAAWEDPAFRELARAFGLTPDQKGFEIGLAGGAEAAGFRISTRSVLGAMAYLSNGVSIPDEHAGLIEAGPGLDSIPNDLMDVKVSASPVGDAFLQVSHRGYWFYIDDHDNESKRTMGLLTSLVRLSISAGGAQNVPVLTLPVSQ